MDIPMIDSTVQVQRVLLMGAKGMRPAEARPLLKRQKGDKVRRDK